MKNNIIKKLLLPAILLTICFTSIKEPIIQKSLAENPSEQILPHSDFDDERNTEDV